jgi:ribosomal protein S27AE
VRPAVEAQPVSEEPASQPAGPGQAVIDAPVTVVAIGEVRQPDTDRSTCPRCGAADAAGRRFCGDCGTKLRR